MAGIWQVYWVDQTKARLSTSPPQPGDASKDRRMYVIVAEPMGRNKASVCPIQDVGRGPLMTEVELDKGYGGFIEKRSKILCHEIYTLPVSWFERNSLAGNISQTEQNKIKTALRMYLRLSQP